VRLDDVDEGMNGINRYSPLGGGATVRKKAKKRHLTEMGGRALLHSFWKDSFGPEKQRSKLHTPQGNHGEPSTGLIHLRTAAIQSGHRAATQSTSSADSADSFGGGAAVVGGSGAE
jgi:hypothetical protein